MRRLLIAVPLALTAAAPAQAASSRVVTQSPSAPCARGATVHPTIQAAIDAANPGDRVLVCPGTYEERVTIDVDRLDVVSAGMQEATIRPAAADPGGGAVVTIGGARGAQLRRFTITGPDAGSCPALDAAVWVRDGATAATVKQNRLPTAPCPADTGVRFGSAAEPTSGSGLAQQNAIEGFTAAALAATEAGTEATFADNTVSGAGTGTGALVAFGARGVVHANTLLGLGTAVRTFLPAAARNVVDANVLIGNGRGIDLVDTDRTRVSANRVLDGGEGIVVDDESELNTFQGNQARGNDVVDCSDESTGGFGTAGTSNTWKGNKGAISVPPGICRA